MNALATINYTELVKDFPPRVIRDAELNEQCLRKIADLDGRWNELSEAEKQLYETLRVLIEDYEKKTFQLPTATPTEVIEFLMEANELKQKDLVGIFETASVASEVLNGHRQLTLEHIRRLSQRFGVSPAVFFP